MENFSAPLKERLGVYTPIMSSLPFFLDADPSYLEQVEFLPPHTGPHREIHETVIDIEPVRSSS